MHECILTHTHTFCAYVSYRNLNILIDNYIIFSTIYVSFIHTKTSKRIKVYSILNTICFFNDKVGKY